MSTGSQTRTRHSVIKLDFQKDDQGEYKSGSGGTINARVGDEIRLAFHSPSGMGPADLDVVTNGDAVEFIQVVDSTRIQGSHMIIGEAELDAVLSAKTAGQATVNVVLKNDKDERTEALVFMVNVS